MPGVTAAPACAAGAGIPLTRRDSARSVTFVTGHLKDGRLDLDFAALASHGQTLTFYMGLSTLPDPTARLMTEHLSPDTPAALIEAQGNRLKGLLLRFEQ